MNDDNMRQQLMELSSPIIDWLRNNHHPHALVIVDTVGAELLFGQMAITQGAKE
jgi:hypothetical protein